MIPQGFGKTEPCEGQTFLSAVLALKSLQKDMMLSPA